MHAECRQPHPLNTFLFWVRRRWLVLVTLLFGVYVLLPWLAPLLMAAGWTRAANIIYFIYSTQCHQLPQRSFFLFGDSFMLPLTTIQPLVGNSTDPLVLRQFVGNVGVGWKVAWSDRMVYMYGSLLVFAVGFLLARRKVKPLPWWGLLLLLLPLAVDGTTHTISDLFSGIDGGFRYTNAWLASLTGSIFPATFYVGDDLGSFNAWMRLLSGILFGLGAAWFVYPRMDDAFQASAPTRPVRRVEDPGHAALPQVENNYVERP